MFILFSHFVFEFLYTSLLYFIIFFSFSRVNYILYTYLLFSIRCGILIILYICCQVVESDMQINERIKRVCEYRKITQKELGIALGGTEKAQL